MKEPNYYIHHTKCNLRTAPGSHEEGNIEPEFNDATGYRFYTTPKDKLLQIMARSPEPVGIRGRPRTVVFFDCNLLHVSGHNLSRNNRWASYFVYNPVANRSRDVPNPRPDYVRSTHFAPLVMGADEILAAWQPGVMARRREVSPDTARFTAPRLGDTLAHGKSGLNWLSSACRPARSARSDRYQASSLSRTSRRERIGLV